MSIRDFMRTSAIVTLVIGVAGVIISMILGKTIPALAWNLILMGLVLSAILFQHWRRVLGGLQIIAVQTGHIMQPRVAAAARGVQGNPFLGLAVILFAAGAGFVLWSLGHDSLKAAKYGVFFLEMAALAAITAAGEWKKWRVWLFAFLAINTMLAFVAGAGWRLLLLMSILTAISFIVMIGKEEEAVEALWKALQFAIRKLVDFTVWLATLISKGIAWAAQALAQWLGEVFSGKYGPDTACFVGATFAGLVFFGSWAFPSFGSQPVTIAGVTMALATVSYLVALVLLGGAVILFAKNRLMK